jgi:hypothetical protein
MVDPRRVVGNPVWAKAMHVSRDCRQIYGADVDKMWICGTVLECMTSKPDGARRATTLIKASYQVGNGEPVKIINIAQLKKDDPNPLPVVETQQATPSHENVETPQTTPATAPEATTMDTTAVQYHKQLKRKLLHQHHLPNVQ